MWALLTACALPTQEEPLPRDRTRDQVDTEYVSSRRCRACHPSEYSSWHASYHRTMTQVASADSIQGAWEGELETEGRRYVLIERDGDYFVDMPRYGSDGATASERQELQVYMTTGSHHLQLYWLDDGDRLVQFPFGWFIREQRWVPEKATFLQPPEGENHVETRAETWSSGCDGCHSVAPRGELERGDIAELGIACEACHGPGVEHARRFQNPLTRYLARQDHGPVDDIVVPSKLDKERSVQACAQCHAELVREASDNLLRYQPGEDLTQQAQMTQDLHPRPAWLAQALEQDPGLIDHAFGQMELYESPAAMPMAWFCLVATRGVR